MSIHRRGSSWTVRLSLRRGDGSRYQRSKGGFRSRREARVWEAGQLLTVGGGRTTNPKLGEVAEVWLPIVGRRVVPSSLKGYRGNLDRYILPELGSTRVDALTRGVMRSWHGRLLERGLSKRTVEYAHATLRVMLKDVLELEIPKVTPPRPEGMRRPPPWSPGELAEFLDGVSSDRHLLLWRLLALTGVRRSEACELEWSSVARDGSSVTIRRSKSGRARVVHVDVETAVLLRQARGIGPVFPMSPSWVSHRFRHLIADLGLPHIRLHDLRHIHASHLIAAGVPLKVVSDRLGHSSIMVTADIYAHVDVVQDVAAAEAAANHLKG